MLSNMSFTMGNFKGNGKVNGLPVFVHQLPLTKGGVMGPIDPAAPAKFGRAVSVDPDYPDVFLVGHPAGTVLKGILMADPAIMRQDPGMRDEYFEGRPTTVVTFGLLQFAEFDSTFSTPKEGMYVAINSVTGEIAFDDSAFVAPGYEAISADVYSSDDANGATIFLRYPMVDASPLPQPQTATPTFSPGSGAVASGTLIDIFCGTPGAVIHYTTDGSVPDATDPVYDPIAKITVTAGVTIRAIGITVSYSNSVVASATYTVA